MGIDQLLLARQLLTRLEVAALDRGAQLIGDLLEDRPVAARIDHHSHAYDTYTRVDDQPIVPGAVTVPEQPPKHSVSVAAAIIDDQGRFLLIRRADNGRWEPPGGILELNESVQEGLIREVEEETGLRITPLALTGVYKNIARGIIALVFRCEILSGEAGGSVEVADLSWFSPDDVRRKMTEAYAVRVLDALRPGPPQMRTHDGASVLTDRA